MPRYYQRKTNSETPSFDILVNALKQVKIEKQTIYSVAQAYSIPKTSIYRLITAFNEKLKDEKVTVVLVNEFVGSYHYGRGTKPIFNKEQELALMKHLLDTSKMCNGLTIRELRTMAFEFAKKLKISIPDNWKTFQMAGPDWYYGFMKRHSNLSLRTPEHISVARAKAFCKRNVDDFFSNCL